MTEFRDPVVRTVDWTTVKDGPRWNSRRMPDGDYVCLIKEVVEVVEEGDDWTWIFTLALKRQPSVTYPYRCPSAYLGFLSALYRAAGREIPKKKMNINPKKLLGTEVGVTLIQDDYQRDNKDRNASKIDRVFPAGDVGEEPTVNAAAGNSNVRRPGKPTAAVAADTVSDDELEELDLEEM